MPSDSRPSAGSPSPRPALPFLTNMALAAAIALLGGGPGRARGDEPVAEAVASETRSALLITGASLAIGGAIALDYSHLAPSHCRYCVPPSLDARARRTLVWDHPQDARLLSDVTANGIVPLLVVVDAWRANTGLPQIGRDLLVVAEAASLATAATEVSKTVVARRRPLESNGGSSSFWSGHTAFAFSIAVSQATQDSLRGDPKAPWIWALGLGVAGAVGYFRVAGDAHWLTDVLSGAAAGSLAGVAAPLLNRRLVGGVTIAPAPGGLALRF